MKVVKVRIARSGQSAIFKLTFVNRLSSLSSLSLNMSFLRFLSLAWFKITPGLQRVDARAVIKIVWNLQDLPKLTETM